MGKYTVTNGQNIFDIALHLYGSIEGVVDLLMNNTTLSLCDKLKTGDELIYTDNYIINQDTAAYLKSYKITPANGEQNIYYKASDKPKIFEIYVENKKTSAGFLISGTGSIHVDWGDNSDIQFIDLSETYEHITHIFDNLVEKPRRITIYGEESLQIKKIDFSKLFSSRIYVLRPIYIERFVLNNNSIPVDFISLVNGIFDIDLSFSSTGDLTPLLRCKQLMRLNLSGMNIKQSVIDNYLIGLVDYYYERRNCSIKLTICPSGKYQEPEKDVNLNYIITSGMEAIWILTHEPSWNESGAWAFTINDDIYTFEKENK